MTKIADEPKTIAEQLQEDWEHEFGKDLPVLAQTGLDTAIIGELVTREDVERAVTQLALRATLIEHIKAQVAQKLEILERDLARRQQWYEPGIRAFIERHPDRRGGRSIKVVTGAGKALTTAGLRKRKEKLVVKDTEAFLQWAEKEDWERFVRVTERHEPQKTAITEHYKQTGELPPGCDIVPEGDNLYIKTEG